MSDGIGTEQTAGGDPSLTLINRFFVHGQTDEFEREFASTAAFFAAQSGFVDHTLLRHLENEPEYVNIARWENLAAFRSALQHSDFPPHAAALRALARSEPNLYTTQFTHTAAGSPAVAVRQAEEAR